MRYYELHAWTNSFQLREKKNYGGDVHKHKRKTQTHLTVLRQFSRETLVLPVYSRVSEAIAVKLLQSIILNFRMKERIFNS